MKKSKLNEYILSLIWDIIFKYIYVLSMSYIFSLENFSWVCKSVRDSPNAYAESLVEYMRTTFQCLGPMDDGSRAGLHFSCCGHVAERLVKLLTDPVEDPENKGKHGGIPPVAKIDPFGLKNLATDIQHFESFADSTGVGQLRDCFNEVKCLATALLDRDMPMLLLPENSQARRKKYPYLSLEKVHCVLEKYVGTGLVSLSVNAYIYHVQRFISPHFSVLHCPDFRARSF